MIFIGIVIGVILGVLLMGLMKKGYIEDLERENKLLKSLRPNPGGSVEGEVINRRSCR